MPRKPRARSWHSWVSIILALPILLVAVTAVLMAHKRSLGTEKFTLDTAWWPGYRLNQTQAKPPEVRYVLRTRDQRLWVGTAAGLYQWLGQELKAVAALEGQQIRSMAERDGGLLVATHSGLWVADGERWQRVLGGDALSVSDDGQGTSAAVMKDRGLLFSQDGHHWAPRATMEQALARQARPPAAPEVSLARLIKDVHTGEALLGKQAEWLWIDLLGIAMGLLALTGVTMWWRGERRKTDALNATSGL